MEVMTPEQRKLYGAALRIGRRFGVGGPWIYAPPAAGDGVIAAPSYHSDGLRTAYIVRERIPANAAAAPGVGVGDDRWRIVGERGADLAATGVLMDGVRAYLIKDLDTDQGYPAGIVMPTGLIDLTTAPRSDEERRSMQIVQGTQPTIMLLLVSSTDDKTGVIGATVTAQISANGGSFATTTNAVAEVGLGFYKVVLTAAETGTLGPLAVVATATGCNAFRDLYKVISI